MWRHRTVFAFQDPTPLLSESSVAKTFQHMYIRTSSRVLHNHRYFSLHFLYLRKVLPIGKEQEHSWLLLMFQIINEELISCQAVIPGSLGQELWSPRYVQPLTKALMNHTLDCSLISLHLC